MTSRNPRSSRALDTCRGLAAGNRQCDTAVAARVPNLGAMGVLFRMEPRIHELPLTTSYSRHVLSVNRFSSSSSPDISLHFFYPQSLTFESRKRCPAAGRDLQPDSYASQPKAFARPRESAEPLFIALLRGHHPDSALTHGPVSDEARTSPSKLCRGST